MKKYKITIVGLGYVGLPLAVEFAKKFPTVGHDIDNVRVQNLRKGNDTVECELWNLRPPSTRMGIYDNNNPNRMPGT